MDPLEIDIILLNIFKFLKLKELLRLRWLINNLCNL